LESDLLIRHLSKVAAGNPIERKEVFAGKKRSGSKEKLIGL